MKLWFSRKEEGRQTGGESGLTVPSEWLIDALGGPDTSAGERVTIRSSLGLVAVFAAVSKLSETVGMLPLKVYRDLGDNERAEASDHRAYRMLHDMPNPLTPAHRFWATAVVHLLLWGNCFIRKERNELGLVSTLWLLDPSKVTIEWNQAAGLKRYFHELPTGEREELSGDDLLHIMDFSLNGIVGESRISRCRESIGAALARRSFEGGFYKRGAVMRGVIEYPGRLNDTVKLRESWTAVYGGSKNAHQVGVLEEGAQFKGLSAPLQDLQFVESSRMSNTEIAVLFGLPPAHLGGSVGDSLTYQTVEGNRLQFADSVAPISNNIAKALATDRGIFPFSTWFPEFELKALMRGDSQARADFYKKMSDIGAMTVDEIRALENLPPLPESEKPSPPPPQLDAAPATNGTGAADLAALLQEG